MEGARSLEGLAGANLPRELSVTELVPLLLRPLLLTLTMSAAALCSPSVLSAVAALRSAQQASRDAERALTAAKAAEVTATRVFLAAAAVEGAFPPEHAAVAAEPVAEPTYACSSQPIRRSPAQLLRMRRHRELARKRYGDHAMLAHLVECDRLRAVARREEHQRQEEERKQEEELHTGAGA